MSYHLGGLRNLADGKQWNSRLNGRKDEQSIFSNCSRKRIEYFLSEGANLKYWSGIKLIKGTLPPFMLYEEMNDGEENWHDICEEIIKVMQAAVMFLWFSFVGSISVSRRESREFVKVVLVVYALLMKSHWYEWWNL